ncbi:MAG: UDP-4-amino-4,6-dideoxy-N-acetyl-beta-L-altrosamine N-acetyltransferase [Flavobacterium sp. JAD_PAG50586_2]|nr:MAG: UDP-4-amino-4,6-dideoxy-N-acetyl-beta-L-altrosamine N-acetyltransferase [Flavobacterium sp. JAD_PAG50586_2]
MNAVIDNSMYTFTNFIDLPIEDKKIVLEWRNDENIRKWMYNTDVVLLENHLQFIERLKDDKSKLYFLVRRKNVPVGVVSLIDIKDTVGDWGYYIAPSLHDKNLGVEFYYYALLYFYRSLKFSKIIGYVLKDNKSANSFSDLFGFTKVLQMKEVGNVSQEYYFREMTAEIWEEKVLQNPKISRLLQLTINY